MTSVTQIWAKTLDQFPLLENLGFILYDNSFTSIPSFSSPSVWMVCGVSQRRRVWTGGGQMIGRRDAETRGSGIRGKPDSPCSDCCRLSSPAADGRSCDQDFCQRHRRTDNQLLLFFAVVYVHMSQDGQWVVFSVT